MFARPDRRRCLVIALVATAVVAPSGAVSPTVATAASSDRGQQARESGEGAVRKDASRSGDSRPRRDGVARLWREYPLGERESDAGRRVAGGAAASAPSRPARPQPPEEATDAPPNALLGLVLLAIVTACLVAALRSHRRRVGVDRPAATGDAAVPGLVGASGASDAGANVIAYVSPVAGGVPTGEQEAAIRAECARRGWRVVDVMEEEPAAADSTERAALRRSLGRVVAGEADAIAVSEFSCLAGSVVALGPQLRHLAALNVRLVVVDDGIDTSTEVGERLVEVIAGLGEWERERIANGTRERLAALRAEGNSVGGPAVVNHPALRAKIAEMRATGMTLQAIADALNAEGVPTLRGGAFWRPSSVQAAAGYRRPHGSTRSRPVQARAHDQGGQS